MTAEQLKNSILQQAVQGKLVPHDPNDEPASVLLERIRDEKDQLVKEGKIKRDKHESVIYKRDNSYYEEVDGKEQCIDDEIPFEIPDSWMWTRLGDYAEKITDQVASGSFASLRANVPSLKEPDYAIMVKTADFSNDFSRNLTYTTKQGYEFLSNSNLFGGELILSNIGSIGKCFIVPKLDQKMTLAPNAVMIRLVNEELRDYLYYFILSPQGYQELIQITSGTAMKKFNKTDLKTILIPLPPLQEQLRIVEKINGILPFVTQYNKLEQKYDQLITQFPDQLKNSILQQAIQGKLVPQDPDDEPASVLLERIRDEKDQLIKEGKIKHDKHKSTIYRRDGLYYEKVDGKEHCIDDEIPFDIPDTWMWTRISSISSLVTKGTTPRGGNVSYSSTEVGFLRAENVAGLDKLNYNNMNYIDKEVHYGYLKRSILHPNDILITIAGTLGRTAIVRENDLPLNANQAISIIRLVNDHSLDLLFLIYALNSPAIQNVLTHQKKITAIPNLTLEIISNCLIPIPPIEEQHRIVDKIKTIFSHINTI